MKKKYVKITSSALIAGGFIFFAMGCGQSKKKSTCNSSSQGYSSGYEAGRTAMTSDCDAHLRSTNNGYGPIGTIPNCWCSGFNDGYNSK